jgi:hypothetical protein
MCKLLLKNKMHPLLNHHESVVEIRSNSPEHVLCPRGINMVQSALAVQVHGLLGSKTQVGLHLLQGLLSNNISFRGKSQLK